MKKIILSFSMLIWVTVSFAQETNPPKELTKEYYLEKSKKQKTGAFIFLGLGTTSIITGAMTDNKKSDYGGLSGALDVNVASGLLMIGGALFVAGSIPMFISSVKNKKKSMNMSFKFQRLPQLRNGDFISYHVPSLTFKVEL